uniref:Uncharacterized protein n=1 Tax=Setaria viridis TaxID=4556 RepID=A0A4U6SPT2_SETVI|nr:hypothetical protein SEVIR_9G044550v2 [Setaria viridis]
MDIRNRALAKRIPHVFFKKNPQYNTYWQQ